ncbi:HNH endonuclease [Aurantimonas sp. HBX-1]|uniref:HNH endonuclease n=1 Tax=Aurantimonas sp. HBX-1 TaxID=2906072 RepID=UPI001F39785B|nr:HNH endonuclease signature motif containing protein [Aurantimonas sp. HBX-1]UIJ70320.1 HNH endonuclease [Aurantimonas sp. HBX-1]
MAVTSGPAEDAPEALAPPYTLETPPSPAVEYECGDVTYRSGFRLPAGREDAWLAYDSADFPGRLWLAAENTHGRFYAALASPGITAEIGWPSVDMPGPGLKRYAFRNLTALMYGLKRVYELGVSLPDTPLDQFRKAAKDLPRTTEAERLVVQRVGQDVFREALMAYWSRRCAVTGVEHPRLLRASHIIPWAECGDKERLDVHNGLLLAAHLDAAFEAHLIGFDAEGTIRFSPRLSEPDRTRLGLDSAMRLRRTEAKTAERLARHLQRVLAQSESCEVAAGEFDVIR